MTNFRTNRKTGKAFPIRGNVTIRAPKKGYISFSNKEGKSVVLKNPIESKNDGNVLMMGIADAHGIESFLTAREEGSSIFLLRAQANRHRHAVFYVALLAQDAADKINEQLKRQEYELALKTLKSNTISVQFPQQHNAEKSWRMIPNSGLNPWS